MKVENVADDGIQREVEGGDHRWLLQLCHRGQHPPVEPAAWDRGRRQDLPGRVVERLPASRQRLDEGLGSGGAPYLSEVHRLATEAASSSWTRSQPGHRELVRVDRRRRDHARRRAEPPVTATT
jgi:hypothetical protein